MTSIHDYSIAWSEKLIHRVEERMRDIHFVLGEFYEKHQYRRSVALKVLKAAGQDMESDPSGVASTIDAIHPAGSFMLRTTVHRTPYEADHTSTGIGADVVLTIPESVCSEEHLKDGQYLVVRNTFLTQVCAHLHKVQQGALREVQGSRWSTSTEKNDQEEENTPVNEEKSTRKSKLMAHRLSRMEIMVLPIHGAYGCGQKNIIRLRFRRPSDSSKNGTDDVGTYETPYIDLHFRPAMHTGRVSGAKATRKHPLYSYLVLEDYMMPSYLQRLHQLCVGSPTLRRAIVLLKCWALHLGLHGPSSGHAEGLTGFSIAAMVLYLLEEGVINAGMSEEIAARAALVYIASGKFRGPYGSSGMPAVEEQGEVAVMRLAGESLNIFFRSTAAFFKLVVEKAASEALNYPNLTDVFEAIPFQALPLRFDACFTLKFCGPPTPLPGESESTEDGKFDASAALMLSTSSIYFSPSVKWANQVRELVVKALESRTLDVTVWETSRNTLQLAVLLSADAESRRRRLTRGPLVEDTKAVEAFNAFWGTDMTSTRQFPDGAIYRCVLWDFPEHFSSVAAVQYVLQFALRKHLAAMKQVADDDKESREELVQVEPLLGGIEHFLYERVGGEWKDCTFLSQKPLLEASKAVQSMIAQLPLNSLPCKITGFSVISPSERQTEVFPVRPHLALTYTSDTSMSDGEPNIVNGLSIQPAVEPIHCVLTIDDRHKIPDDLEAIELMKAAIGAQISKTLTNLYGTPSDNKSSNSSFSTVFSSCHTYGFDIVYQGFLFRVYIAHFREVSLLRALQRIPRADMLEQKLFWSVRHAGLLKSIAFGHQSFSTAVRLAKRWVSSMCLYEFILPEVIELIVAEAYLRTHERNNSHPNGDRCLTPPKTGVTGFFRFLELLATFDWSQPLVLSTAELELDGTQKKANELLRIENRKQRPQQAIFIATPYAPTESPFTTATPRPMVLHRLVEVAKNALRVFLQHFRFVPLHDQWFGVERCAGLSVEAMLFRSDLSAFDLALPLHPKAILFYDRLLQVPVSSSLAQGRGEGDREPVSFAINAASRTHPAPLTPNYMPGEVERVWQVNELSDKERAMYWTQRIERDPAGQAVRAVRAALRDKAMVFYDALAPSYLFIVALTEVPPTASVLQRLSDEAFKAGEGVVLPDPWVIQSSMPITSKRSSPIGKKRPAAPSDRAVRQRSAQNAVVKQPKPSASVEKVTASKKDGAAKRKREREEEQPDTKAAKKTKTAAKAASKKKKPAL